MFGRAKIDDANSRADALAAEVVVGVAGRSVARLAGVDDQHPSPRPAQRHRPGQARGSAADHHHIKIGLAHLQPLSKDASLRGFGTADGTCRGGARRKATTAETANITACKANTLA